MMHSRFLFLTGQSSPYIFINRAVEMLSHCPVVASASHGLSN